MNGLLCLLLQKRKAHLHAGHRTMIGTCLHLFSKNCCRRLANIIGKVFWSTVKAQCHREQLGFDQRYLILGSVVGMLRV